MGISQAFDAGCPLLVSVAAGYVYPSPSFSIRMLLLVVIQRYPLCKISLMTSSLFLLFFCCRMKKMSMQPRKFFRWEERPLKRLGREAEA